MYKLLIVEDECETRNGLANYFPWNDIGFEVIGQLENGMQVLKFIHDNHVDAILCDIIMPGMSGLDLVKELYRQKLKIAVVFLSGYKDFEFAQTAIECGVKNYIIKPTKYSELAEVFFKIKDELDSCHSSIINDESQNSEIEPGNSLSFNDKIIVTIKEYVKQHCKDATLEDVANLVHMNPFYLSKFFKEKAGQKFSDFVNVMRMERASKLLMDINYKIYEVGDKIGYNSTKSFSRSFKKFFGKSPKEYRNYKQSV